MGCIRVDKITEYLCEPLRKCLKDEDPYVRKTAAVCVAKLHDINAQLVEDQGFLDSLRDLLSDSNPMVSIHVHTNDWTSTVLKPVIFTCTSKSSSSLLRKWAVSVSFLWYPKLNCIPTSLVTVWYLVLFEKVNFFSFSYWFLNSLTGGHWYINFCNNYVLFYQKTIFIKRKQFYYYYHFLFCPCYCIEGCH